MATIIEEPVITANREDDSTTDQRYIECQWRVERFPNVYQVVTRNDEDHNFDIKCYKRSRLLITNDEEKRTIELAKLYISLEPEISLIMDVLEPEWLNHLFQQGQGRWMTSQTSKGPLKAKPETYKTLVSKARKSQSVIFTHAETPTIALIENRIALIAGIDVAHLERLVMVKYEPGDYFGEHHDGAFRTHTLLLYLNDSQGGETVFPNLEMSVLPMGNCGLFWKNITGDGKADFRMLHAGTSPKTGTKWIVNCFFNVERIREM